MHRLEQLHQKFRMLMQWRRALGRIRRHRYLSDLQSARRAFRHWRSSARTDHLLQTGIGQYQRFILRRWRNRLLMRRAAHLNIAHTLRRSFSRWRKFNHQAKKLQSRLTTFQHFFLMSKQAKRKSIQLHFNRWRRQMLNKNSHSATTQHTNDKPDPQHRRYAKLFRRHQLMNKAWKPWRQVFDSALFEQERKMIFAELWNDKILKRKVLNAWMVDTLEKQAMRFSRMESIADLKRRSVKQDGNQGDISALASPTKRQLSLHDLISPGDRV